ncbi:hypothetical protein ES711_14175 [Gelidibacter salicanalis]|uniref:Uncharacterized protein n=1 Tax=Gelidibacter salicanalis TaxID=291193 RepID=A0A5C7AB13_9FLAO|nr:hypothetical protein [Gelidibacter salicanalis]TXE05980.1 hypothetical protein ES711_14175 [Gelidibacter salicanalis]
MASDLSPNNVFDLTLMADSYGIRLMSAELHSFTMYNMAHPDKALLKVMDKGALKNKDLNLHVYSKDGTLQSLYRLDAII